MRRAVWLAAGAFLLLVVLVVGVFPTRAYLAQRQRRRGVATELQHLTAQNKALDERVRLLHSDAEIERLAREQYNLVKPGEEAYAILPSKAAAAPAPAPPAHHGSRGLPSRIWHDLVSLF